MGMSLSTSLSLTAIRRAAQPVPDVDPVWPDYPYTQLSPLTSLADIRGSVTGLTFIDDGSPVPLRHDIPSSNTIYIQPAAMMAPIDIRGGNIVIPWQAIANLSPAAASQLDRFNLELYSAGTLAAPGTAYHELPVGTGNTPSWLRADSTAPDNATPGQIQFSAFHASQLTAVGGGADLSAITHWRLHISSTTTANVIMRLGAPRFQANPRTKATAIFTFDDGDVSQYSYAFSAMSALGFPGVLYPGAVLACVDQPGKLTSAHIAEMRAAGWQLGSQAYTNEAVCTQAEVDALRAWQKGKGARPDGADGSYYSGFNPHNPTAQAVLRPNYRSLVRFDSSNPSPTTPVRQGEPFPIADRHNIKRLSGMSADERLIAHANQAIQTKGVAVYAWHNELATAGTQRTAFEALLAHLDANRADIEVLTWRGLVG